MALQPVIDPELEESSFAYRKGRGVADAVRRVAALRRQGFVHVVDADISRFFESVPHEPLLARLGRLTGSDAILDLVALWLEWNAPGGVGLAQGSPLSPALANLYLDGVDEAIEGRGVRLVRYADDFVLLTKSEAAAEGALKRVAGLLGEHGLTLNAEKTRIASFDQGFRFLGHMFVRSLALKAVEDEVPPEDAIRAAEAALSPADASDDNDTAAGTHAPGFRVLYVMEAGRCVSVAGEAFSVLDDGAPVLLVPHGRVGRIELWPETACDMAALDLAAASGVMVARVNGLGETIGIFEGEPSVAARGRRQMTQAALHLDPLRRLELARRVVAGRIRCQRAVLHRLNRVRRDGDVAAAAAQMGRILRRLIRPASVEAAMGFEGQSAALYWPALGRALDYDMGFTGKRRRRPAGGPFDALLNALTALLSRDIRIAVVRAGLHPGFGALHSTADDGREALVHDLMEEFRSALVESVAVALVNRRAVSPAMFAKQSTGFVKMDRVAWQGLVRGYEAAASRTIASPLRRGQRVTWRQAMEDQALLWAAHCEGRGEYEPIVMDY
jgi:CRISPR-associated protein Cas1